MQPPSNLIILLVEDDPSHAAIVRRTLDCIPVAHRLIHVEDGQIALDYLDGEIDSEDVTSSPRPDLILLDLNMPKVGGFEVLEKIRENKELRKIPTVILTTSDASSERDYAYSLGAISFQVKPMCSENFMELLKIGASIREDRNSSPIRDQSECDRTGF